MPWLKRIGLTLLAALSFAAIVIFAYVLSFARSLPSYDGTRTVAGISSFVTIARDRYGIPHIQGATLADTAFGLGYAQAQDRLFQMEMTRRFIQGRLSERIGALGLDADVLARTYDLYGHAQASLHALSPEVQAVLTSYAAGVNAYLSAHKGPWPLEIALTGGAPEPWKAEDSLAVLKGMEFQLSGNMYAELARVRLLARLGRKGVQDFLAPFSAGPLPSYLDMLFQTTRLSKSTTGIPDITASDNWVVDGAHSQTGKPLLANDPHLGFDIPSTWYLAHLSYKDGDVVGGTLPGVPGIVVGRNRHVAWGLTNTGPDTQDVYIEQVNPDNPNEYRTPDGWREFETRNETIKVRFGGEKILHVRSTRHGPVLSDNDIAGTKDLAPDGYVLSLAWAALTDDDTTYETLLDIDEAKNAADIKAAAPKYIAPMQNIVFADDSGNIGLVLPGRVPIRAPGNDSLGLVPAPGWEARYDWQGFIPADQLPFTENPESGRIVTANNKTVPDDYPYSLSREWEVLYRHDRIDQRLQAVPKNTLADFEAIQNDPVDLYAAALKPLLLAAGPFMGGGAQAAKMLENWNGAMDANDPRPLIFTAWARALQKRIFADELGDDFKRYWGYRPEFTIRVLNNIEGEGRWCDNRLSPVMETCADDIRAALDDAVKELTAAYGADMTKWRWGDAHKAVHSNPLFGGIPLIGPFFNREVEMSGGAYTPLRGDMRLNGSRPYAAVHGAGYRAVYDLSDPDKSQYVISTGESGNVFAPHYDDLLPLWAKGKYIEIPTAPAAILHAASHYMTFKPISAN